MQPPRLLFSIISLIASGLVFGGQVNIDENIKDYNSIIQSIQAKDTDFITLIEIDLIEAEQLLLDDGIHITKHAHSYIAQEIYNLILKFMN